MFHFFKKICLALMLSLLCSPVVNAQVLVIDSQLNGSITERNRLLNELLNENMTMSHYTNELLSTVGVYRNFALDDIRYPTELLVPRALSELGLEGYNITMLATPLAFESFIRNYVITNSGDMVSLSDEEFLKKYEKTKSDWNIVAKDRQRVLSREALLDGYAIAYAARLKAASTGSFIQNELRARALKSTSIREDLAIENLALAEIVGQLGTLVATSAARLEIDAVSNIINSSN